VPTTRIPGFVLTDRVVQLPLDHSATLAYFDTGRASNGGTEATNGLIELHRRSARGFRNRDNYRLCMLLIGGGPDQPHQK
jgi:transposase